MGGCAPKPPRRAGLSVAVRGPTGCDAIEGLLPGGAFAARVWSRSRVTRPTVIAMGLRRLRPAKPRSGAIRAQLASTEMPMLRRKVV